MKTEWTNADIDAAYLMGVINATCHKVDIKEPFPSLVIIVMEIERLKELGFENPHDAVRRLRYKTSSIKVTDEIIEKAGGEYEKQYQSSLGINKSFGAAWANEDFVEGAKAMRDGLKGWMRENRRSTFNKNR